MSEQVEVILFDMGGTLRRTNKVLDAEKIQKTRQILELIGTDASPLEFAQVLTARAEAYKHWAEEALAELDEIGLWTHWMLPDYPEEMVRKNAIRLNQMWRAAIGTRIPFPETKHVVLELFRRGYRLGLVSNTTSSVEVPQMLDELGITGCFEAVILSCVIGIRKPDPGILQAAIKQMDVLPESCAYVGDRPNRDVASARKAGLSKTIIVLDPLQPAEHENNDSVLAPDHFVDNLNGLLDVFPSRVESRDDQPQQTLPVYDASLSTMWAKKNFSHLSDFFIAARRFGFARVELNHQIDSAMLAGVDLQRYQVSSVHEPCPADISADTYKKRDWLISSENDHCRREGVKSIQRTIDLAEKLGSRTIIIHAGNVYQDNVLEKQLRILYTAGQNQSDEYQAVRETMIKTRLTLKEPRLAALKESMLELLDYAAPKGVKLGLENRYHYMEFPLPDELELLLGLAGPDRIGFVYDVGHAETLDRLGFCSHEEWLKRFAPRIVAIHLHDVIGLTDHSSPGTGTVNFAMVAKYLPVDAIRTCEFHGINTPGQVKAGLKFLAEHGCINLL